MGNPIPPGTDLATLATDLADNHSAVLSGGEPTLSLRSGIVRSWTRAMKSEGVVVDRMDLPVLDARSLVQLREKSPLGVISGRAQRLFRDVVDDAELALGIFDANGVLLWRGGSSSVLSVAERVQFVDGSDWSESYAATTAIGLAIEDGTANRVFGAEHFIVPLHSWYCAAAPIHDPRTGELIGVIDLSGPAPAMQRSATAFASTIAALCERELADHHRRTLNDLADSAAGHLAAIRGPALLVDRDGWVAASRGIGAPQSIAPPSPGVHQFVAGVGECAVDAVGDGWLVYPVGSTRAVIAELDLRGEPSLSVDGDDPWRRVLTRRHAQILLLLADAEPAGLTAVVLSRRLFGEDDHVVTVRAEMSRLRRSVGALVSSRPYRLAPGVSLRVTPDETEPPRTARGGKHQRRP